MNLIFLPGLLCDARLWRHQLPHFPGAQVADLTQDDSLEAMAARVLAGAPERFGLVALSMGGYVAFELLRQAPERITHLALFATSARQDEAVAARRRRGLLGLARHHRFLGVSARLLPSLLHPESLQNEGLCGLVMQMGADVGREAFLRQQTAILARPDSRPGLGAVRVPAVVGVGAADQTTPPEWGEEIAAGISGAELVRFERSGHLPPLEEAEKVTAVIVELMGK